MRHTTPFARLGAAILALALLLTPAQALTVEQCGKLLDTLYVDPVPQEVLDQPDVPSMLSALGDRYTQYFTPEEYADFLASMADITTVGIGVVGAATPEGLALESVMEDSPAAKGGLQVGDVIVSVDKVSLAGMGIDEMTALIQGEEGSRLTVEYRRGTRRGSTTLTRASITIAATDGEVLPGGIGYIACATWGNETAGHFRDLIARMDGETYCWLIDLRGNGGGFTQAAADVAGLFCDADYATILLRGRNEEAPDGYGYDLFLPQYQTVTAKPVVILVDEYSASSSELFTAALRDSGRAIVVGSRTFGKGVAQTLVDQTTAPESFPDGDAMKITIARAYDAVSNTTDGIGVIPHFLCDDADAPGQALLVAQTLAQAQREDGIWKSAAQGLLNSQVWRGCDLTDIEGHPFAQAIATLATYGLVQGKGDGQFRPADTLTRAELAQIIANVLPVDADGEGAAFADVSPDDWYAPAVAAAVKTGLMNGVGEGNFAPDRVLTRQEMFAVLGRLGRRINDDLDRIARTAPDWLDDLASLQDYADWAKNPVWLLSLGMDDGEGGFVNLLWSDPEYIQPTAPANRAETAEVLAALLCYLNILP